MNFNINKEGWILELGITDYEKAFRLQKKLVSARTMDKIRDTLILLEHPPVFTANRDKTFENILVSGELLEKRGVRVCRTDRGGDVTYHGPGQIVGYNIMDLTNCGKDLHAYIRNIEQMIIDTLLEYGIKSARDKKHPGVWVGNEKIAAIGISVKSQWISMHGFALNVNPDMDHYKMIVPCGIEDKGVTSMRRVLGEPVVFQDVKDKIIMHYCRIFGLTSKKISLEDLTWL